MQTVNREDKNRRAKRAVPSIIAGALVISLVASVLTTTTGTVPETAGRTVDFSAGAYDSWDGVSYDFSWYTGGGPYTINSAAQLAAMSILTNDLSAGQNGEWDTIKANVTAALTAGLSDPDDIAAATALADQYIAMSEDFFGSTITLNADIDLGDYDWLPISYPWRTASLSSTYAFDNTSGSNVKYNAVDHIPELETVDIWVGDENGDPISTRYWEFPESEMRFRDLVEPLTFEKMNELTYDTVPGSTILVGRHSYNYTTDSTTPENREQELVSYGVPTSSCVQAANSFIDYQKNIVRSYHYKDISGYTESNGFNGMFDGGDHNIKGLKPSTPWTSDYTERLYSYDPLGKGLFSMIGEDGTVSNLNVKSTINGEVYSYSGILCGYNYGIVDNCYVDSNMAQGLIDMVFPVARDYSPDHNSTYVLSSDNYFVDVPAHGTVMPVGNSGFMSAMNYGTIKNCITVGSVTQAFRQFGFMAAINNGRIENCENRADLSTSAVTTDFITDEWTYNMSDKSHVLLNQYLHVYAEPSGLFDEYKFTSPSYDINVDGVTIKGVYDHAYSHTNSLGLAEAGSASGDIVGETATAGEYNAGPGMSFPDRFMYFTEPEKNTFFFQLKRNGPLVDSRTFYDPTFYKSNYIALRTPSRLFSGANGIYVRSETDTAWLPGLYNTDEGESVAANHLYGVYSLTVVGGICAENDGTVSGCENKGDIAEMGNTSGRTAYVLTVNGVDYPIQEATERIRPLIEAYKTDVDDEYNQLPEYAKPATSYPSTSLTILSRLQNIMTYFSDSFRLEASSDSDIVRLKFRFSGINMSFELSAKELGIVKPDTIVATNKYGETKTIHSEQWKNYYIYESSSLPGLIGVDVDDRALTSAAIKTNTPSLDQNPTYGYYAMNDDREKVEFDESATLSKQIQGMRLLGTFEYRPFGNNVNYAVIVKKGSNYHTDFEDVYYYPLFRRFKLYGHYFKDPTDTSKYLYIEMLVDVTDPDNPVLIRRRESNALSTTYQHRYFSFSGPTFTYNEGTDELNITAGVDYIYWNHRSNNTTGSQYMGAVSTDTIVANTFDLNTSTFYNLRDNSITTVYDPAVFDFVGTAMGSPTGDPTNPSLFTEISGSKAFFAVNSSRRYLNNGGTGATYPCFKITTDLNIQLSDYNDWPAVTNAKVDFDGHIVTGGFFSSSCSNTLFTNIKLTSNERLYIGGGCKITNYEIQSRPGSQACLHLNEGASAINGTIHWALNTDDSYGSNLYALYAYHGSSSANRTVIDGLDVQIVDAPNSGAAGGSYRSPLYVFGYIDCKNVVIDADSDDLSPTKGMILIYSTSSEYLTRFDNITIGDFTAHAVNDFIIIYMPHGEVEINNLKSYVSNIVNKEDVKEIVGLEVPALCDPSSPTSEVSAFKSAWSNGSRITLFGASGYRVSSFIKNSIIKTRMNQWGVVVGYPPYYETSDYTFTTDSCKISISYVDTGVIQTSNRPSYNIINYSVINSEIFIENSKGWLDYTSNYKNGQNRCHPNVMCAPYYSSSTLAEASFCYGNTIKATELRTAFGIGSMVQANNTYYVKKLTCSAFVGMPTISNGKTYEGWKNYSPVRWDLYNTALYAKEVIFEPSGAMFESGKDGYAFSAFPYDVNSYGLTIYADNVSGEVPALTPATGILVPVTQDG